jgi:hypothetical protein
MYVRKEKIRKE